MTNSEVKALQRQLNAAGANLAVDGIYGSKTAAANAKYGGGTQQTTAQVPTQLTDYVSQLQGYLTAATPTIARKETDTAALKSQLAASLRPGYDQAIDTRRQQTVTNKANIDADAAARGMGASTYVTDVKNRQQNAEAKDISTLEGDYSAALASALMQQLNANDQYNLSVDQYNASAQANALQNALSLGSNLYSQYLTENKKSSGKSGGDGTSDDELRLISEIGAADGVYNVASNALNFLNKNKNALYKKYSAEAIQKASNFFNEEASNEAVKAEKYFSDAGRGKQGKYY